MKDPKNSSMVGSFLSSVKSASGAIQKELNFYFLLKRYEKLKKEEEKLRFKTAI